MNDSLPVNIKGAIYGNGFPVLNKKNTRLKQKDESQTSQPVFAATSYRFQDAIPSEIRKPYVIKQNQASKSISEDGNNLTVSKENIIPKPTFSIPPLVLNENLEQFNVLPSINKSITDSVIDQERTRILGDYFEKLLKYREIAKPLDPRNSLISHDNFDEDLKFLDENMKTNNYHDENVSEGISSLDLSSVIDGLRLSYLPTPMTSSRAITDFDPLASARALVNAAAEVLGEPVPQTARILKDPSFMMRTSVPDVNVLKSIGKTDSKGLVTDHKEMESENPQFFKDLPDWLKVVAHGPNAFEDEWGNQLRFDDGQDSNLVEDKHVDDLEKSEVSCEDEDGVEAALKSVVLDARRKQNTSKYLKVSTATIDTEERQPKTSNVDLPPSQGFYVRYLPNVAYSKVNENPVGNFTLESAPLRASPRIEALLESRLIETNQQRKEIAIKARNATEIISKIFPKHNPVLVAPDVQFESNKASAAFTMVNSASDASKVILSPDALEMAARIEPWMKTGDSLPSKVREELRLGKSTRKSADMSVIGVANANAIECRHRKYATYLSNGKMASLNNQIPSKSVKSSNLVDSPLHSTLTSSIHLKVNQVDNVNHLIPSKINREISRTSAASLSESIMNAVYLNASFNQETTQMQTQHSHNLSSLEELSATNENITVSSSPFRQTLEPIHIQIIQSNSNKESISDTTSTAGFSPRIHSFPKSSSSPGHLVSPNSKQPKKPFSTSGDCAQSSKRRISAVSFRQDPTSESKKSHSNQNLHNTIMSKSRSASHFAGKVTNNSQMPNRSSKISNSKMKSIPSVADGASKNGNLSEYEFSSSAPEEQLREVLQNRCKGKLSAAALARFKLSLTAQITLLKKKETEAKAYRQAILAERQVFPPEVNALRVSNEIRLAVRLKVKDQLPHIISRALSHAQSLQEKLDINEASKMSSLKNHQHIPNFFMRNELDVFATELHASVCRPRVEGMIDKHEMESRRLLKESRAQQQQFVSSKVENASVFLSSLMETPGGDHSTLSEMKSVNHWDHNSLLRNSLGELDDPNEDLNSILEELGDEIWKIPGGSGFKSENSNGSLLHKTAMQVGVFNPNSTSKFPNNGSRVQRETEIELFPTLRMTYALPVNHKPIRQLLRKEQLQAQGLGGTNNNNKNQ